MSIPSNLFYTQEHEWVADPSSSPARVGITAFAANALGDVVFVDLPDVGAALTAGAPCGEIESTKSVSEIFSPLNGTVVEVNAEVVDAPELVNDDPYGKGWLFAVQPSQPIPSLLDAAAYAALPDVAQ
ncbi:MAG: glycine cleavage system protein GcvH [Bifidobacteriaceae bacterium]|jgi:glycine cleavage system H protein|nr:glycine cleavage system protein GcvH [Bifidobacteriaceae bacterium]